MSPIADVPRCCSGRVFEGRVEVVPAGAGPAVSLTQAQTARISYRPYELQSAAGTQAVFDRINRTARRVCRHEPSFLAAEQRDCQRELAGQIVGKIGSPGLLALWNNGHAGVQLASRGK